MVALEQAAMKEQELAKDNVQVELVRDHNTKLVDRETEEEREHQIKLLRGMVDETKVCTGQYYLKSNSSGGWWTKPRYVLVSIISNQTPQGDGGRNQGMCRSVVLRDIIFVRP